jgi:phosphoglycerate dehydrogenase-like enzyme
MPTRRDLLASGLANTAASTLSAEETMPFRIAVCGDYERLAARSPWSSLGKDVEAVIFNEPFASTQATTDALQNFDAVALMRERTPLPRAVLEHLPRLKLIVFNGPSNATLDYAAAVERKITICHAMGARTGEPQNTGGGTSPAELTLALMMACAWQLPAADALVRRGGWAFQPGVAMRGKVLGIVGYGNIGKPVGSYGKALGMKVLGWSRSLTDDKAQADGIFRADLETLLRTSDVVTVHLPLNAGTSGIIGAKQIGLMKPGAFLINTARAAIVDQAAMIAALRSRKLAMAGLDVFDQEPLPQGHPLLSLPNVVMTPHIGYVTEQSMSGMYSAMIDLIASFRSGVIKGRYTPDSR